MGEHRTWTARAGWLTSAVVLCTTVWVSGCGSVDRQDLPAGDSGTCTEIPCVDGVEVFFEANHWWDGEYLLTLTVDGAIQDCTVTLPPTVGLYEMACGKGAWVGFDDQQGIWGVHVDGVDRDWISVELAHETEMLGQLGFQPDYWNIRPNGDQCPGACQYASETLHLPALAF